MRYSNSHCLLCWGRVFFISWVGTWTIKNYFQYRNCSCYSSLVKRLLYDCAKASPRSALLLVTLKFSTISFADQKLSIFDQTLGSWRRKLESSQRISKISLSWESKNLEDIYLIENQVDAEVFSGNFFHDLHVIAWQPSAALFQAKQHCQKKTNARFRTKNADV